MPSRALLPLIAVTTVPATVPAAETAALYIMSVLSTFVVANGCTYGSANACSGSSGNGGEEGRRAVLSQCQKGNGSNEAFGVGKHVDDVGLKSFLLDLLP